MDEFLIEATRLFSSDEFKVAILVSSICAVPGLVWGIHKAVRGVVRKRRVSAYNKVKGAISFSKDEFMAGLEVYVRHKGMFSDPSAKVEMSEALLADRVDAVGYLDSFLAKPTSKHLLVLADCGMGKTTFLINYFYKRSGWLDKRGLSVALVSLAKTGYMAEIESVPVASRGSTVLLMDALDEDPLILDGINQRVRKLLSITEGFRAVVISCRSHFFRSDDEIPILTGSLRAGPTPAGISKEYEFSRIYLAPFDSNQVAAYLNRSIPGWAGFRRRRRAHQLIREIPSLIVRPMLLVHVADIIEAASKHGIFSEWDLYQAITSAWAQRESHWIDVDTLLKFSTKLAINLYQNRDGRGGEFCSYEELNRLARDWDISVKPELLAGRSLLNRTEDGRCKFAHRSILEYFVAESITNGVAGDYYEITSQISRFIFSSLGVTTRTIRSKVDDAFSIELLAPLNLLGYPTNYSLLHTTSVHVDPALIYGMAIKDERGCGEVLGEFIQSLLDASIGAVRVSHIRITASEEFYADFVELHISIWFQDRVVLSRVRADISLWGRLLGSSWSDRKFHYVVGNFPANHSDARSVNYSLATFSNTHADILGSDGAEACSLVSANVCTSTGRLNLRMIAGVGVVGPLSVFGILRGGSASLYQGKRYGVLQSREIDVSVREEEVHAEASPLQAPAERWAYGRKN